MKRSEKLVLLKSALKLLAKKIAEVQDCGDMSEVSLLESEYNGLVEAYCLLEKGLYTEKVVKGVSK